MSALVKEVPPAKAPKIEVIDGIDAWKVRDAANTLQQALKIRGDKKLFNAARKVLRENLTAARKAITWADNLK